MPATPSVASTPAEGLLTEPPCCDGCGAEDASGDSSSNVTCNGRPSVVQPTMIAVTSSASGCHGGQPLLPSQTVHKAPHQAQPCERRGPRHIVCRTSVGDTPCSRARALRRPSFSARSCCSSCCAAVSAVTALTCTRAQKTPPEDTCCAPPCSACAFDVVPS